MNRRTFLSGLTATAAATSLSGCAAIHRLTGSGGRADNTGQSDETSTPNGGEETFRVDFVDETDTLGHVAEVYSTEEAYDDAVNEFDQDTWEMMEENDIDEGNANGLWRDGDLADHLGEIRPFVDYTLGQRDDLPGYDTTQVTGRWGLIDGERVTDISIEQVRESDKNWAEKLAWGTGFGVDEILTDVASGYESALTVMPGIEYFADELFEENREVNSIIAGTKEPNTPRTTMDHLSGLMSYRNDEGQLDILHAEPTLGGGLPGSFNHAVGNPNESIYAEESVENAASPVEYRKALRLTREGKINNVETVDITPEAALSTAMVNTLWNFADEGTMYIEDDFQDGEQPPLVDNPSEVRNAFGGSLGPDYVTPEFGRSVEDHIDAYDETVETKMTNIGRGIETFYQEFGQGTSLGIAGTVEEPEFYRLRIEDMQQVMENAPNNLSQYT